MEAALVAKVGAFVFAGALGMPAALPISGAPVSLIAASTDGPPAVMPDAAPFDDTRSLQAAARHADEAVRIGAAGAAAADGQADPPAPAQLAARSPASARTPPPGPVLTSGSVLASWYGPGFYGNRTACGLTLTPEILGVAHLTLPCGSPVTLTSPAGRTVTVPVIDRGPYAAGRTLDLTAATKLALACTDLCHVRMTSP